MTVRISTSRNAFLIMFVSVTGTLGTWGCSTSKDAPDVANSENTGTVGLQLQVGNSITVNAISYDISGNGFHKAGSINVQNSRTIAAIIGGIPAGTGYVITLTASAANDSTLTCSGSATFNVAAGTSTTVQVHLECKVPPKTGSISVSGSLNICPTVDALTANPAETIVGSSLALAASASDKDQGPQALTYAWTTSSGVLASASSASPTFTCTSAGVANVQVTVSDGDCVDVATTTVTCSNAPVSDAGTAGGSTGAGGASNAGGNTSTGGASAGAPSSGGMAGTGGASSSSSAQLSFSLDTGVAPNAVTINLGTAIGQGSGNGATPFTLADLAADPNNSQTITRATNPFGSVGNVPDTAFGFCDYSGATPKRVSHITGAKFETTAPGTAGADPMVPMAPFYFPLVYNSTNTPSGNAFGGQPPIIGLFDWRPKDIDEALVAAESDDNGKTWFFMQTVLELFPDYTNPISGGFSTSATATGCPATVTGTNAAATSLNGSTADDGWGHASIIQLPGVSAKTGQYLYMLDRNPSNIDLAPLNVINLTASSNKFPIWNTNNTAPGANDIKSISSALVNSPGTAGTANAVVIQQTTGLLNPDGIMAVFPTTPSAPIGTPVTVLYVQKILNGDNTGTTALPAAQQCTKAPFSGKSNHDISNVRLATTTDGVNFVDQGIVAGLNDPTTVDYNKTRWVSPRGTLIDVKGDGSVWGLLFSGGNCLDGDSDAFHYIGYAESTDMRNWTVLRDINQPIASINTITAANQAGGASVTIPANAPVVPTQAWFAQRLYAPTATQIDATHLSLTFAGYAVQTPANNLLAYRQIGNVVLTVSRALPTGVPNNINAH